MWHRIDFEYEYSLFTLREQPTRHGTATLTKPHAAAREPVDALCAALCVRQVLLTPS
jgi:hypothetical protein